MNLDEIQPTNSMESESHSISVNSIVSYSIRELSNSISNAGNSILNSLWVELPLYSLFVKADTFIIYNS